MIERGYSLVRMEILNWGNFQDAQAIDFRSSSDWGPLFQPAAAAAILGQNGSGKTSLIDGLMVTLLPFEHMVKLGVTHDVESGGSGGRSVRDYVLGKYSSSTAAGAIEPANIYSRKNGCSMVLLQFQHNVQVDRFVTVGRVWWFQNFKLSDSNVFVLKHGQLSIKDLCPQGLLPRSQRDLKEKVLTKDSLIEIFDTANSYFLSLSTTFGNVTKDDLKILNRAFYVKSITQIDQFIRENMLIENECPHLEMLLENVQNGREVAAKIETCSEKLRRIEGIIKSVERLIQSAKTHKELVIQKRLFRIHSDWEKIQLGESQLTELEKLVIELKAQVPALEQEVQSLLAQWSHHRGLLAEHEVSAQLSNLELQISSLNEKIQRARQCRAEFERKLKILGRRVPKTINEGEFINGLKSDLTTLQSRLPQDEELLDELKERRKSLLVESESLKKECEHLVANKSFIPRELYQIKLEAIKDLDLPSDHLCFVGEMIQIKESFRKDHQRAIEACLEPISRNLLCHPESLDRFTLWLNKKGLTSNITIKRISADELKPFEVKTESKQRQILSMIDIFSPEQSPFHYYLCKWLWGSFDFTVVEAKDLKRFDGRAVTLEGIVKSDPRTMRKLRKDFRYYLGWDTRLQIEILSQRLLELNDLYKANDQQVIEQQKRLKDLRDHIQVLESLQALEAYEFLRLDSLEEQLGQFHQLQKDLTLKNRDFQDLQERERVLQNSYQTKLSDFHKAKANLDKADQEMAHLQKVLPEMKANLYSGSAWTGLLKSYDKEELLVAELREMTKKRNRAGSLSVLEQKVDDELERLQRQREDVIGGLGRDLNDYRRNFDEANVHFSAPTIDETESFYRGWKTLRDYLEGTELVQAKEKFRAYFDQVLMDSIKNSVNELKSQAVTIERNIDSINSVLRMNNFEDLLHEKRYLKIEHQPSQDDRIRRFKRKLKDIEKVLLPAYRSLSDEVSSEIMMNLEAFVGYLMNDPNERNFVTDVRNHFQFCVHSLRREDSGEDIVVEIFTGAKNDAKSSAQTTHLAYTLLASSLAYRFKFNDPIAGKDCLRLIVLDEFGGKFDNEKPKDVVKLLEDMGFQSVFVSPMSKADLLAEHISQIIFVYKVSSKDSKIRSLQITKEESFSSMVRALAQRTSVGPELQ